MSIVSLVDAFANEGINQRHNGDHSTAPCINCHICRIYSQGTKAHHFTRQNMGAARLSLPRSDSLLVASVFIHLNGTRSPGNKAAGINQANATSLSLSASWSVLQTPKALSELFKLARAIRK